ncbi:hypothetical protein B0H16DRAFT_1578565, partial [Mycena metata]
MLRSYARRRRYRWPPLFFAQKRAWGRCCSKTLPGPLTSCPISPPPFWAPKSAVALVVVVAARPRRSGPRAGSCFLPRPEARSATPARIPHRPRSLYSSWSPRMRRRRSCCVGSHFSNLPPTIHDALCLESSRIAIFCPIPFFGTALVPAAPPHPSRTIFVLPCICARRSAPAPATILGFRRSSAPRGPFVPLLPGRPFR